MAERITPGKPAKPSRITPQVVADDPVSRPEVTKLDDPEEQAELARAQRRADEENRSVVDEKAAELGLDGEAEASVEREETEEERARRERQEAFRAGQADAKYVVGRKPIRHMGLTLYPGEGVPGAENWLRIESRLRAGTLVRRGEI